MKLESVKSESQAYVRQVGLAGVGVVGKVQKESVKLFETLVEEGKKVEARRGEAAKTPALAALKALMDKALAQLDKLQQVVQERAAGALRWVGVASQADIQELFRRLDEIQASIQELIPASRARKTVGE